MKSIIQSILHSFPELPLYKKSAYFVFIISFLSFIFIFGFQNSSVSTAPVGWEKPYPLVPFDTFSKNIRVDHKGNIVAVIYEGEKNKEAGIYVSLSFDNGVKFLNPVKITTVKSITDLNPDVSISSIGHIAAVWQELSNEDPNSRIFYSISKDMGAAWSDPVRIKSQTEMELLPKVLYDDKDNLHIFYNAYKDKGFNLFHIKSSDEVKFSSPESLVVINEGLRGAFFPAVHSSGEYIYLVWQSKEKTAELLSDHLYFIKSGNYGRSWTSKKMITETKAKDSTPYIISRNNDLFLVYQNNEARNWGIKYIKGSNHGDKWENPVTISNTNSDCYSPAVVISEDDNLYVIWYDMRNRIPGVFAKKISSRGLQTSTETMLSRNNISARKPAAVSFGKKVMIMWEESGRIIAVNSDIFADPPVVYSPTHPENVWARSSKAVIKWNPPVDESGISGYAYFLKRPGDADAAEIDPMIANIGGNITEFVTPDLEDGISYFYIRAIDGVGNYSRTVAYKIMVSKNPPQMPIVKSSTHPDGKSSDKTNAVLNWSILDQVRNRGFLYSLSKDSIKEPDIFTTDREVRFDNLTNGRYFFTIRAIDKTNLVSRVASYQIIVGDVSEIDPELLRHIAMGELEPILKGTQKIVKIQIPTIDIYLPFDIRESFGKSEFIAEIKTKNIKEKSVIGYSYILSSEERFPDDRINLKANSLNVKNLKNGNYYISAKCRYYKDSENRKDLSWTEPVIKRFSVSIGEPVTIAYYKKISDKFKGNYIAYCFTTVAMLLSLITLGFGTRIVFYLKFFRNKILDIF